MKITDVKIRFVEGLVGPEVPFYNGLADLKLRYVPMKNHYNASMVSTGIGPATSAKAGGDRKIVEAFLNIETDEGVTGVSCPLFHTSLTSDIIKNSFRQLLIGEDPLNIERIWDILYRRNMIGYAGVNMMAISFVDIALWDIKCKKAGLPLWQMAGGATQKVLPAYANCTGCALEDDGSGYIMDKVAEQTKWCVDNGYTGAKWYPHRGPANGRKGIEELYEMFKVIREVGGPDFKLMLDVWSGWDVDYALKAAKRLAALDLYWMEEPIMPNIIGGYEKLRRESPIDISMGESVFGRWSFKQYLDTEAADIYQPDPAWCGGISECLKIMNLIALYDKRIALHGYCVPIATQLTATFTANVCPISEFLVKITPERQFFFKNPVLPKNGNLYLPEAPGVGLDIDEGKVIRSWYME